MMAVAELAAVFQSVNIYIIITSSEIGRKPTTGEIKAREFLAGLEFNPR